MLNNEFDSVYSNVKYIEKNNVVLITWKQFCCYEDYRKPTSFALDLLKNHAMSNFIIDARNGFEDEKEDVDWAFTKLLPEMSKTDCKYVIFIMNEVNEIEGEIDMWTKEFMKYFTVKKVSSYDEALKAINESIY
ncbi:hypothetical protein I5677_01920 [Mobilitalea sibirica]|uniref:Uncharacterized protein n=1 Tax=Mobilitalea sibirica TaxID=1462919 RepID=A0A8J7KZ87_9FIRM|nr:hypothetical protein [Mobilitalea sibirica]MBH1939648.1 hypothetical protein [Mobilitalea sibirica]